MDQRFEDHRRLLLRKAPPAISELTPEQIRSISDVYYAHILDEDEQQRLEGFYDREAGWAEGELPDAPQKTFEESQEDWGEFEAGVRFDYARGRPDDFFLAEAEDVLDWDGIDIRLSPSSPSWKPLARSLQEAVIRASKGIKQRDLGEVVPTPEVASKGPVSAAVEPSYPLFSTVSANFLEEGSRGGWTDKTKRDYAAWLRDFTEAVGDRPLDQYSKADGRAFKAILAKRPPNRKKRKQIASLSISKAADKGAELGMPPMSPENANKAMNRVSAFWKWADSNYFDDIGPAPLSGMAFKLQDSMQDKRDPFSEQELSKIFSAPIYKGYESPRGWKTPGHELDTEWSRYWLPLIGLYTGAREGEIFGLTVDDVLEEQGVPIFRFGINPERDTRVKSRAGLRDVPVHSKLVELGLLKLVNKRQSAGHTSLFHDCEAKTPSRAAHNFSQWFSRFLAASGAKTEKNAFHSFRHTVNDALTGKQVDERVIRCLLGHKAEGMGAVYGSGAMPVGVLKEAIEQLEFAELK